MAYDLGVDVYVALWSPVILPAAQAVVAPLAPGRAARILDVGTGSGALVPFATGGCHGRHRRRA